MPMPTQAPTTNTSHLCNLLCNCLKPISIPKSPKDPPIWGALTLTTPRFASAIISRMASQSEEGSANDQKFSYRLNESCKLVLQPGDITKWHVNGENDAIVNAADERMLGGGGVDGAIHRAAGPGLLKACQAIPEVKPNVRCPTGSAKITEAFDLPVSRVIHTVGPIYTSSDDPSSALSSAYRSSVTLAKEIQIKYIAFPAISCGVYGYPAPEAAEVALSTLQKHASGLEEVHFVLFNPSIQKAWLEMADTMFEKQEKSDDPHEPTHSPIQPSSPIVPPPIPALDTTSYTKRISDLEAEVESLKQMNDNLQQTIAARDKEIANLKSIADVQGGTNIMDLFKLIAGKDKTITTLNNQILQLNQQIITQSSKSPPFDQSVASKKEG